MRSISTRISWSVVLGLLVLAGLAVAILVLPEAGLVNGPVADDDPWNRVTPKPVITSAH